MERTDCLLEAVEAEGDVHRDRIEGGQLHNAEILSPTERVWWKGLSLSAACIAAVKVKYADV